MQLAGWEGPSIRVISTVHRSCFIRFIVHLSLLGTWNRWVAATVRVPVAFRRLNELWQRSIGERSSRGTQGLRG